MRRLHTLSGLAAAALLACSSSWAQAPAQKPQYGGALSVANVYYTISPLTFDTADMAWKINQDNVQWDKKVTVPGSHYVYSDMTGGQLLSVLPQ